MQIQKFYHDQVKFCYRNIFSFDPGVSTRLGNTVGIICESANIDNPLWRVNLIRLSKQNLDFQFGRILIPPGVIVLYQVSR